MLAGKGCAGIGAITIGVLMPVRSQLERPDVVLSYTIRNNIYGARAARAVGAPFLPNVTGLGTAFLSGKLLQTVTEQLYRRSFSALPTLFFQNEDDRDLFLDRTMVARIRPACCPALASIWSALRPRRCRKRRVRPSS